MSRLRVHNLAMSLDGYVAGAAQSLEEPLGVGGRRLHDWVFATRFGRQMIGETGGTTALDHRFAVRGDEGIGATIMGRNMFGPIRGDWVDGSWRGWWGEEPPYHHDVFVLTHHPRDSVAMTGGTTFHFVDDGIEVALERAVTAARGADVRLGGGPATIRQYLRARLVDELHVALVPILLGGGERLFADGDDIADVYECVEMTCSPAVSHIRLVRRDDSA